MPAHIPEDWPLTREEYALVGYTTEELALDRKVLEAAGLHSRKDIVDFANRVLERDVSPISRDRL